MSLISLVPKEVTQCPVCAELLEQPRQLPGCLHVYCLNCIDAVIKHITKDGATTSGHCPLCHAEFDIPSNGAAGLPTNRFIEKLTGVTKLKRVLESYDSSTDNSGCEVCAPEDGTVEAEDIKPATHYCFDCSQRTCKQCAAMHRKLKATSGHELLELGAGVTEELIEKRMQAGLSAATNCDKHPNDIVKIYCRDCRHAICSMCHLEAHNGHDCADVNTVVDELRQQMKEDIKHLMAEVTHCRSETNRLDRSKADFARTIIKIQQQVGESADRLRKLVDEHRKHLLAEIGAVGAARQKETESVETEVTRQLSALETLCRYANELSDRGTACDIAEVADRIRQRTDTLRLFDVTNHVAANMRPVAVSFTASHVAGGNGNQNVVGCVSVLKDDPVDDVVVRPAPSAPPRSSTRSPSVRSPPDATVRPPSTTSRDSAADLPPPPSPPQPTVVSPPPPPAVVPVPAPEAGPTEGEGHAVVVRSTAAGRPILGLALANNELYVVRQGGGSEIEVYDVGDVEEKLMSLKRRIQVPGLGSWPSGLAFNSGYLYVSDFINNAVHRIESFGMSTVTGRWRVTGGPTGLSIIEEGDDAGSLVVACSSSAKVQVYTLPQGVLKYELHVGPEKAPGLCFAVRLIGGQFAIIHSTDDAEQTSVHHGVCIVVKGNEIPGGLEAEGSQNPKRSPSSASTTPASKPKKKILPQILRKDSSKSATQPEVQQHQTEGAAATPTALAFEGKVLLSYGDGHLKGVKGLAIDFGRGRAFVADRDNNRVVIVEQALDDAKLFKFALAPGVELPPASGGNSAVDQLVGPRCVLLDHANGRLFVGEEAGGRLVLIRGLDGGSGR